MGEQVGRLVEDHASGRADKGNEFCVIRPKGTLNR